MQICSSIRLCMIFQNHEKDFWDDLYSDKELGEKNSIYESFESSLKNNRARFLFYNSNFYE